MPTRLLTRALALANLRAAYNRIAQNKGAPGVDEISIRRFAREWETHLVELRASVRANTYKPQRLRQFQIRKPSGGTRTISICTVRDRILQRAVLNVLEEKLDAQFLDCAFGYRPGRSTQGALDAVLRARDDGFRWVLDGDIEQFFESLDHTLLLDFLREDVDDARIIALIELWLKVGRRARDQAVGTPLGMVVSPLLSNVYLHRFDLALTRMGLRLVRYADDFIILGETRAEMEEARRFAAWALGYLRLKLSPAKTRVVSFDEGFDYLGVHFYRDSFAYLKQGKRVHAKTRPTTWDFLPPEWY
ncbi:MAG: group II intron reverse transcriptase/maturase [Chloroflexi bacterium]|nr:group II intron reverse transcriptase/maturase [Chloroflexota bacterium]